MDETVRWSLVVSKQVDVALRTYLAGRGMKKGDLSKFVEDAVRWRVLDRTVSAIKARNRKAAPREIDAAIDEAVAAARARRFKKTA